MIRFSFLILCVCCYSAVASAQRLNWVWLHFPPAFIGEGPLKNQGIVSRWLPQLQTEAMAEFTHQFQHMTPARAWQTMKEGELLCHPAALYDEKRAELAAFSLPWNLVPNKAILIRKEDAERLFSGQKTISVTELFARRDLRLGLLQDQNYYVQIDRWLKDSDARKQALQLSNKQPVSALYHLLLNRRIDYMLEYPWVGGYIKRLMAQEGKRREEIVSLAIEEISQFIPAYIACTNNKEGRDLIQKINHWLLQQRSREVFRQHIALWLDDNSRQQFLRAYEAQVAPVTKP